MSQKEPNTWLPSRHEERIEEALGELYKAFEQGKKQTEEILPLLDVTVGREVYDEILSQRFIEANDRETRFTEIGRRLGEQVIRRCRLSERLLSDVLNANPDEISAAACQFEHVLSPELTDSICTLLGHPSQCPHENPIPPGECCNRSAAVIPSVVVPLKKMASRQDGRIAYLLFKQNPDVYRLMSLGLAPGQKVRLLQKVPNYVLEVGEAQLAIDEAIAADIYVRPLGKEE